ncbi:MAG TPA: molybdopterin-dependent oxidoreductase [Polyangiaceae bacterium]|nr:molybdopterin-dependent oxidoreductase [Polyangiaceae bacterium]
MSELRRTTCNRDCPDACAIVATVENGKITHLAGDPEHPVTRGFLCYRTSHFLPTQYSPDRLLSPMLRQPNGEFAPIGWDEALDLCAARLRQIRDESGAAAIFHYRSGGSLGLLKHLTDYFFEKFGPVTVKRGDICSGAGDAAQLADFGDEDAHDLFDLLAAKSILLWGKNVYVSSPHTLPVLREAKKRGTRLMLIDPVHHQTASLCNDFVQPRPAGDFALAMGVARLLFERGFVDPQAATFCDHLDEFRALAMSRRVEDWCADADVTVAEALEVATCFGPGKPCAILVGWGMGRRKAGGAVVRALDALSAISGNIGISGGGVSYYYKRRGAFHLGFIRGKAAAPRTLCEPLFGQEVLAAKDPPVRAVWITAGNPVAMLPDSMKVAEALRTREFVVVVDTFLTDTARLAHLVLPTTTLLEEDDLLGAYGHHYLATARPVVAPPPGVKSDLAIAQALAQRLGLAEEMAGTPQEWKERMVAPRLARHGITVESLDAGAIKNPLATKVLFEDRKFKTESGRMNLMTSPPPAEALAGARVDYPLWLMSLSTPDSQSSQWTRMPEGPLVATVHPDGAAGIEDGGLARLESPIGALEVRVVYDAKQRRDVVIVPKGGHLRDGRCPNVLVRAATTDIGEGGALYDERVRLVRTGAEPSSPL